MSEPSVETALEWQIAEGSATAHVLDAAIPSPRRGERGWCSGPRALCKRYPQRNGEHPWWAYPVGLAADEALRPPFKTQCPDCAKALAALSTSPEKPSR